jgi:serine/threonine-protein kinase RsbW
MPDNPWIWQCERVIPSRAGAGRRVQEEILEHLEQQHWIAHDVFSVRLAMEEAMVNAIKHGNHFDARKRVRVRCCLSPASVVIRVSDDGDGFDPGAIPDPTDPKQLDLPSGRGVMLMKSFMSRVEFNAKGNEVTLQKDRARPETGRADAGAAGEIRSGAAAGDLRVAGTDGLVEQPRPWST